MGKKKATKEKIAKTSTGIKEESKEKKVRKNISLKETRGKEKPVPPNTVLKKTKDEQKPRPKKAILSGRVSSKPSPKKPGNIPGTPRKTVSPKPKSVSTQDLTFPLPEIMSVESAKFEMKPPEHGRKMMTTPPGAPHDLPVGYGETKVVIMVRDPEWIFAYWEINDKIRIKHDLLRGRHDKTLALRIFDVTGVKFNGANANRFYDVIINDYAVSWYLRMPEVNRIWCVDLGYYDTQSGNFTTLARSNTVKTPPGAVSLKDDEEWMQIKEGQYEEILRLSSGLDIKDFRGSENLMRSIAEKINLQLERSLGASGSVTSGQTGKQETNKNNFWLTVNTDIIVYGATEPGAMVTIQGKKASVRKDGTFSVYFSLPDGTQTISVKAVNARKDEERKITPKIIKETR